MGVTFSLSTYAVNRKSLLVKSNLLYASTLHVVTQNSQNSWVVITSVI
jgi:hypothetical protein